MDFNKIRSLVYRYRLKMDYKNIVIAVNCSLATSYCILDYILTVLCKEFFYVMSVECNFEAITLANNLQQKTYFLDLMIVFLSRKMFSRP
jgi:hypothetical protein